MLRNNADARRYSYFDLELVPAMEVLQFPSTIYQSQERISHSLLSKSTPDKIKFFKKTQEHNKILKKQKSYKLFYNFLSLLQKAPM